MVGMALRTIRTRWKLFFGTFVALTFGITVMASMFNILFTINQKRAFQDSPTRYGAASAVIVADQQLHNKQGDGSDQTVTLQDWRPLLASTAKAVSGVDGVKSVIVDRSFSATITNKPGATQPENRQTGHGWSSAQLTPFHLVSGHEPQMGQVVITGAIAHSAHLAEGDTVTIATPDGISQFTVAGIVRTERDNRLPGEDTLFFNDIEATRLSGAPKKAAAIGVIAQPGQNIQTLRGKLTAVLTDKALQVKTGTDKGGNVTADIYNAATATALDLVAFNISIAGFVCIFIVAATVSFAVAQRRQEMALLRLIGATPRQVARMVTNESLVVALIAAATGSLLAIACSSGLSLLLRHYGLAPSTFTAGGTWLGSLLASVIGVGVAFTGVFFAARQAGKVRAVEAMRNAVVERRVMSRARWFWGIFFLGVSIGLVGLGTLLGGVAAMALALFETLLLAVALALLMPALVRPVVHFATIPLVKGTAAVGLLTRANLQNAARRTTSTAAPILLAVAITVSVAGVNAMIAKTDQINTSKRALATNIISTENTTIPVKSAAALRELPGVSSVDVIPSSVLYPAFDITSSPTTFGVADAAKLGTFDISVMSGSLERLGKNDIVVTSLSAQESGWKTDEAVSVYLPDGAKTSLRVAAVVNMPAALPNVLLSPKLANAHINSPMTDTVFIRTNTDADAKTDAALKAFAASVGGQLQAKQAWLDAKNTTGDQQAAMVMMLGLALVYLGIAIANTLLMAANDRGRDIEMLRKLGASNRQIIGMITWETIVVVAIGSVLAAVAAALTIFASHRALAEIVPNTPFPFFQPAYAMVIGVSLLVALSASIPPTVRQIRKGLARTE